MSQEKATHSAQQGDGKVIGIATNHEIVFPDWYDALAELEFKDRGYLPEVEVRFSDGTVCPLYFYDPIRLAQDLAEGAKWGCPYVAELGLIVIPEITRAAVVLVVARLVDEGFFSQKRQLSTATTEGKEK